MGNEAGEKRRRPEPKAYLVGDGELPKGLGQEWRYQNCI